MSDFSCSDCDYEGKWKGLVSHNFQSDCDNDLEELVLQEFNRVAERLGKTPTRDEYRDISRISVNSATRRFDSTYNSLIKASGRIPNKDFSITKQDLVEDIKSIYEKHGYVERRLMRKEGKYSPDTCEDRFGSWNDALREADVEINQENNISKQEYFDELKRLKQELGHVPSGAEMNEHGKYSAKGYNGVFGTYNKAVKQAGMEPKYEQYASGPDSHAYGVTGRDHPRYGRRIKPTWVYNEETDNHLRSNWEFNYDNLLYRGELDYIYEKDTLYFDDFTYLPDFFVEDSFIVEIKGYGDDKSIRNSKAVMERLEDKEYIVVGSESTKRLRCDKWFSWEDREDSIEYMKDIVGV